MSGTDIKCIKVGHTYPNGVQAIKDVDVTIKQGEIVSVVGQNGSGKTTLVKHFNGLLKPTDGDITVGDLNTRDNPVGLLAESVGYVFQNPNHQIFAASVHEELSFGLKNIGLEDSEIEKKVKEIAEEFLLTEYLELNPYRLGFSLRKTVGMASIIAMEPNVVILDEPTTGLHFEDVKVFLNVIDTIVDKGNSVLIIEHNLDVIKMADHIIDIGKEGGQKGGQLICNGTPEKIVKCKDSYTARYLKSELN